MLPEIFALNGVAAKYFRLTALGNSAGSSNSYTEVRFYTSEAQIAEDRTYWPVYFGQYDGMIGQTVQVLASGESGSGKEVPLDGVVFTSDNPKVATVNDNGLITFVSPGSANITATYNNGFGNLTQTIDVICK